MQSAALTYLKRHRDEHLAESDLLFNACVNHLVTALEVPVFLAESLVQRAWNELFPKPEPKPELVWTGVDPAPGETCSAITDRLVSVRLINERPKHP
ncbi:hypothetical protein D3C78_1629910 [compost metagenome]